MGREGEEGGADSQVFMYASEAFLFKLLLDVDVLHTRVSGGAVSKRGFLNFVRVFRACFLF